MSLDHAIQSNLQAHRRYLNRKARNAAGTKSQIKYFKL